MPKTKLLALAGLALAIATGASGQAPVRKSFPVPGAAAPQQRLPPQQPQPQPSAATSSPRSVRTAAREQAMAQLDDPDRLARIGALEDILAGQDAVLIDLALHKVLVSTDQEMKAVALRKLISDPQRTFIFTITGCGATLGWSAPATEDLCRNRTSLLSGAVPMVFDKVDPVSGQFLIRAPYSRSLSPGKVQGSTLNFRIDLDAKAAQACVGRAALAADGALKGELSCSGVIFAGHIDLF